MRDVAADVPDDPPAPPFADLISPLGVVAHVRRAVAPRGMSEIELHIGAFGSGVPGHPMTGNLADGGSGTTFGDRDGSSLVAVVETAERYAGFNLFAPPVRARESELDGPVLDTSRLPRCSAAEYAAPGCPLVPYDPTVAIRWVRGVDLMTGQPTWVPAVMAHCGVGPEPDERFWNPISTGMAAHTDPRMALAKGIMEVAERDSIAITWLQRMPLPPLPPGAFTDATRHLVDQSARRHVTTYLFDATTDLGVPTVYCLQYAAHDERAQHVLGCAAAPSLARAAEKALLEAITARHEYYSDDPVPADFSAFTDTLHGARFMATPDRADAFSFLHDAARREPSRGVPPLPTDPGALLDSLIGILADRDMQAVAVDCTPDELRRVGLTAVMVVIPGLQPMSLRPLAQYRAHARLYDAPRLMGFPVHDQEGLNPWPQPFG